MVTRGGPPIFCFSRTLRPGKRRGRFRSTKNPMPASKGVISYDRSWPLSGRPASRRRLSRAPSPQGRRPSGFPVSRRRFQISGPVFRFVKISKPSSPVYPVRATKASPPSSWVPTMWFLSGSAKPAGIIRARMAADLGPCRAMPAVEPGLPEKRAWGVSFFLSNARTSCWREALTTRKKLSGPKR